jgi:hypothetical protein
MGLGLSKGGNGRMACRLVHGRIDVGTKHKRLAPVAHGTVRILPLRLAKGAHGFRMVKGIRQPQSLVKIALRQLLFVVRG